MEKELLHKGVTGKLVIDTKQYHCFLQGFYTQTTIRLEAPQIRCVSEVLDEEDIELLEEIYTEWFKQAVNKKFGNMDK